MERNFWKAKTWGIAAKLYCFAFLSLLAVGSLVTASIYFSRTNEDAARSLYEDGFIGVLSSARLELLIENHRRIVESMPSEVDRKRIAQDRTELKHINQKLQALMGDIASKEGVGSDGGLTRRISEHLPTLDKIADQVVFFAHEFAQDKAAEAVEEYSTVGNRLQVLIRQFRDLRLQQAQKSISVVSATASSLKIWVLVCALIAVILIGPVGLTTIHRAVTRLASITQAMVKIAHNETATAIPSRCDPDEVGEMARAVEVFKDNAIQLKAREIELQDLNGRIDVALNNMTHGLCMFDAQQNLIVCNKTYLEMYSLPPELARPGVTLEIIESYRASVGSGAIDNAEQIAASNIEHQFESSAFTQALMDGRTIAVSQRPMSGGGFVAVHEDITERRHAEDKISHLARYDMLTNLPNRVLFREQLESELARSQAGRGFAIHCLDLDQFKAVNDTLGHPVGDKLLKKVAERLAEIVRSSDFVSRIGGDEFAVVQTQVATPEQCSALAAAIVENVAKPYDIDGRHIVIGTSIGIAIAPNDGVNPDQLLKNADMALYLAKADGRGTYRFFEREMDRRLQARHAMELDLRKAIVEGQFELHYQPIVCLKTGATSGFEALVRWNHPTKGQIPPAQFIALAEETGLILPLGEWVLRTACAQAAKWPAPISVSVNLSAAQFKGRNLVQLAMNALASSGLAPNRLDIEITETLLLQDEANTFAVLHQLRNLGIRISLDDFGTGYSSLAYLRNFPYDKIKIDRSFVQDMLTRDDCRAIVRAVVGLAQSLGINTTVEGVETKEQLKAVRDEQCDTAQGYFFAKPMPEREVAAFIVKGARVANAA